LNGGSREMTDIRVNVKKVLFFRISLKNKYLFPFNKNNFFVVSAK